MSKTNNNGHLKLACWLIGIVVMIVGISGTLVHATLNGHDARIRINAENSAANKQWQEDVTRRLERIENKVDERDR